jgi:hypothetical protein
VRELLEKRGVSLVIGDDKRRPLDQFHGSLLTIQRSAAKGDR